MSSAVASGALTGTTTLTSAQTYLNSVTVTTDGTNAGTVTVFDNTAGSGKVTAVVAIAGASLSSTVVFFKALRLDVGLTVVVTGTGATGYVSYGAVS